jgi:hypothetical protein
MKPIAIEYRFTLPDDLEETFRFQLDPVTLEPIDNLPDDLPEWSRLEIHQCPHCPLTPEQTEHCPAAAHLVGLVQRLAHVLSFETVTVDVFTEERHMSQQMAAQKGIGSLMGLLMAASGCPNMAFFRPMARFHVPWASEQETLYRAASTYLLTQYFRATDGQPAGLELDGLLQVYRTVHQLNKAFVKRLHLASIQDAVINALVALDLYAQLLPYSIRDSLKQLRHLFAPVVRDDGPSPPLP